MTPLRYVRFFDELGLNDVRLAGGKNASLGELYRAPRRQGVPVPNGFAVTAQAYRDLLTGAGVWETLHAILDPLDPSNVTDPGVKEMLRQAVEGARRNGRHSGICGQAPSDHPETMRVAALEATLGRKRRVA